MGPGFSNGILLAILLAFHLAVTGPPRCTRLNSLAQIVADTFAKRKRLRPYQWGVGQAY